MPAVSSLASEATWGRKSWASPPQVSGPAPPCFHVRCCEDLAGRGANFLSGPRKKLPAAAQQLPPGPLETGGRRGPAAPRRGHRGASPLRLPDAQARGLVQSLPALQLRQQPLKRHGGWNPEHRAPTIPGARASQPSCSPSPPRHTVCPLTSTPTITPRTDSDVKAVAHPLEQDRNARPRAAALVWPCQATVGRTQRSTSLGAFSDQHNFF